VAAVSDWPGLIVEAGFDSGSTMITAGNLILDDVTLGKLGTGTLSGGGITWTDITPFVQDLQVTRPGNRQQGPIVSYESGTATLTLNNSDARFSPDNLAGPYVAGGVTKVRPMVPVRVRITWGGVTYPLFSGFADSWIPPTDDYGLTYAITQLAASDAFRVLEGIQLPVTGATGGGELSGARVNRILNAASWYDPAWQMRAVDPGISALQATTFGDSALSMLQTVALSELGDVYMDPAGVVTFRDRYASMTETRSNTVQAVFGDRPGTVQPAGTELRYSAVTNPCDDTTLANDVQATIDGGTLQHVTDTPSVARYLFPRTFAADGLLLQTDAEALEWASYVLHIASNAETRFDELTIQPVTDPASLWPQVLGRDLGDRIQVWRRPPPGAGYPVVYGGTYPGTPVTRDCFIRGIGHTWTAGEWVTTWTLQDTGRYTFMTLDSAILGKLDTSALAYTS
jgi:hypothetical protein